jgi:excisionase family DNA binding protein
MRDTDVLTLSEAAALLRCHPRTLRKMAADSKIPARRVGKLWRFSRTKLTDWLSRSSS